MHRWTIAIVLLLVLGGRAFGAQAPERVRIAIIDTGISTRALAGDHIDAGRNYILPGEDTEDKLDHGTAIASLILGKPDRDLVGAFPEAILVPLVYFSLEGEAVVKGDAAMLARSIYDAVETFDCRVINLSAGILLDSPELKAACDHAEARGVVVVSAVGNDGDSAPENIYYPAAYETVIGVGALDSKGQAADFSQANASVSLLARGEDLWVARASGRMTHVNGTSYATALVTGAVAELLAHHPDLTPGEVRDLLYKTADDLGEAGHDPQNGHGALDLSEALAYARVYPGPWEVSPDFCCYEAIRSTVTRVPPDREMVWTLRLEMAKAMVRGDIERVHEFATGLTWWLTSGRPD